MYFPSSLLQLVLAYEVFVANGAPAAVTPEPPSLTPRFPHIYPRGDGGVFPTGAAASGSGTLGSGAIASATVLVEVDRKATKTGPMFTVPAMPTGSGGLSGYGNSTKPRETAASQQ